MAMKLPTEFRDPIATAAHSNVLLQGPHKFGKTSLCAEIPDVVFVATEPGQNFVRVKSMDPTNWVEFQECYQLLKTGNHGFKTVVIDTLQNAFKFCKDFICAKYKISDPGELPDKMGYTILNAEFYRAILAYAQLPGGLWLISHAKEHEIKTKTAKLHKIGPALPGSARDQVCSLVDFIFHCDYETDPETGQEKRIILTKPSSTHFGGDRTGHLPPKIEFSYPVLEKAIRYAMQRRDETASGSANDKKGA